MIKLLNGKVIARPPVKPLELTEDEKKHRQFDDVERCCRFEAEDWHDPNFNATGGPHNWRNYITPQLKDIWPTLTDWQKKVIVHALDDAASQEIWD